MKITNSIEPSLWVDTQTTTQYKMSASHSLPALLLDLQSQFASKSPRSGVLLVGDLLKEATLKSNNQLNVDTILTLLPDESYVEVYERVR